MIENLGGAGLDKAIEKLKAEWEAKAKERKYLPNAEICPSCEKPANTKDHEFLNVNTTYLTDENGDVSDTLKFNPQTNKKDKTPTIPKPKGK